MTLTNSRSRKTPFINRLGVEFVSARDGIAVVALNVQSKHLNSWGAAHGGVLMSLVDVAMARAGRSICDGSERLMTVEMKVSFLRPAKTAARITGTAHAFCRSGTLVFCECAICDEHAGLIAKAIGTFKYLKDSSPS